MQGAEHEANTPIWPAFGDLMACLFGVFVLFFVWMLTVQVVLSEDLESARREQAETTERVHELERALALPLAAGLITLVDGNIGISGGVLFESASASLSAEGAALLDNIAGPLAEYLRAEDQAAMISGFTDERPLSGHGAYRDNWELSAERALTVTRALIAAGLPSDAVFAAGFGANYPVASNETAADRAKNRRVEIRPFPRPKIIRPPNVEEVLDEGRRARRVPASTHPQSASDRAELVEEGAQNAERRTGELLEKELRSPE